MTKWMIRLCYLISSVVICLIIPLLYHTMGTRAKYDPDWTPDTLYTTKDLAKSADVIKNTLFKDTCDKSIIKPDDADVKYVHSIWQIIKGPSIASNGMILVFGAYFDARPNVLKENVRVFGVATTSKDQSVYCQLWYSNFSSPVIIKADVKDTGRGLTVGPLKYQERLYSCEIADKVKIPPLSISLGFTKCENTSNILPINFPSAEKVHDFGICVVVAYGVLDPVALVEWIELNLLLGVTEFNIYDSRIDEKSRAVFKHYEKKGIVNLYKSAPPVNDNWCKWCQKLAVIPALNDCMYRNMFRYKHLVVIDFDEFIIPAKHTNLSELIATLRSTWKDEPASYLFRNAYFFKEFPVDTKAPQYLTTVKYLNRAETSKYGYAAKSIINPKRCVVMQNHYCIVKTPDLQRSSLMLNVIPTYGQIHHYKNCHFKDKECQEYLKKPILDRSVIRFEKSLNHSVHLKLVELKYLH